MSHKEFLGFLSAGFVLFLLIGLAGCAGSAPPPPDRSRIQAPDGKWVEQRITRHFSRRPEEIYYVYRDTAGNYIRHGSDTHYYLDGQVKFEEHYRDGQLDSVTEFWYPNGAKQGELPYRDGKPDGKAITWFPNGKKKSEKNWSAGQMNGPSIEWNEKGAKVKEVIWNHNALEKVIQE